MNGLRSLIKDTQSIDNLFEQLNADVVCFQVESFGMHYYRYLSWDSFWCKIWKAAGNYNSGKQPKQTWRFDKTFAN